MDLSDKGSGSEDMSSQTATPERVVSSENQMKTCVDCGTNKTPLWRGGPAGPKSLCNACGIRSRKKRRALLGLNKEDKKPTKKSSKVIGNNENKNQSSNSCSSSSGDSTSSSNGGSLLKKKSLPLQRPRSNSTHRRNNNKLGEVEQAAFLLMSLSCGPVYA
ncbi:GATA transcription factor 16-like [Lycium barbarum]|uniref:GATA transcription factor 16-like n=1 Tax=Lycium barbarum TaxID=112863 RepID=UPI00293EF83F|nr:GATA transcription factor 16-like [Lycium barbarum]XP_060197585.1 GATA transcription factor 16-like [Lycium barbarum]